MASCPEYHVSQPDNYKGDNEVESGTVHRYPGIYLKADENPGKPQLMDGFKFVLPAIVSKETRYLM